MFTLTAFGLGIELRDQFGHSLLGGRRHCLDTDDVQGWAVIVADGVCMSVL